LAGGLIGVAAKALNGAADATWWKQHLRIDKSLVQEVVDDIEPDDSAVVAWVDSADLETVAPAFRGFGGKVLHTTLPPERIAKFESVSRG